MDRPAPNTPQQRDLMFCHQCDNEWYRDEHGLQCPECHSDFCEIIEPDHDPRADEDNLPVDLPNAWEAPDPDEEEIDHFHWQQNGPGEPPGGRLRATLNRTINVNGQNGQPDQIGQAGGITGLIGHALQGLLGGVLQQYQPGAQNRDAVNEGGPQSTPGLPGMGQQEQGSGDGRSFTRHVHGPGYSFTMTTSSSGNLHPRNANAPQPFQAQPDNMDDMMRQMLMNIGVFAPGMQGPGALRGGLRMGPGGFDFTPEMNGHTGAGGGVPGGPMPFPAGLFQMLGMPMGGVHGDAVYSQEGLDRIISQLMEQHQTGNAPGPASEAAIKSLPTRPIEKKDLGENGTADCSICMDSVQPGELVTVLPCEHWFHGDCIKAWLGEHDTCPHCRQGIMPREDRDASQPRQPSQPPLNDMSSPQATLAAAPGAFPVPAPDSGETTPASSTSNQQTSGQGSSGVFDRMREAFGSGGNAGADGGRGGNDQRS